MVQDLRGILLDITKGAVTTAAIFVAYLNLPVLGMLAGVAAPYPALYFGLKRGTVTGSAIVLLAAAFFAVAGDLETVLLYLIQAGILSLVLPLFLRRTGSTGRAMAYSVLLVVGLLTLGAVGYSVASGVDIQAEIASSLKTQLAESVAFYKSKGVTGDDLTMLQEGMDRMGAIVIRIYPALVGIGISLIAGLNVVLLQRVASRLPLPLPPATFSRFRNPDYLVWVLIVAGFALAFGNAEVGTVAVNVLIVVGCLYFLQGLAVIRSFFGSLGIPALLRYVFYVLLAVQAYLAVVVALIGLFDLWGDFRRPRIHKNL